jgi:hypothetical protein
VVCLSPSPLPPAVTRGGAGRACLEACLEAWLAHGGAVVNRARPALSDPPLRARRLYDGRLRACVSSVTRTRMVRVSDACVRTLARVVEVLNLPGSDE